MVAILVSVARAEIPMPILVMAPMTKRQLLRHANQNAMIGAHEFSRQRSLTIFKNDVDDVRILTRARSGARTKICSYGQI